MEVDETRTAARLALIRQRFFVAYDAAAEDAIAERIRRVESAADSLRAVPLTNGVEPMARFLPDLSAASTVGSAPLAGANVQGVSGDLLSDPQDIAGMLAAMADGRTTATALAEEALRRLDSIGRSLNAVVSLLPERALRAAAKADEARSAGIDLGPLHGVPCVVKDLFSTVDAPTTWGAAPLRDQWIPEDAAVVGLLEEAGAVIVGKVAMVELAGGFGYEQADAALTGPGRNPWNPDHWAGGSSTGSGAVVGAGCVPFAIGTETWGSITNPSALCGITGFRPTFGSVSRRGAMALSWSMDKIGPMARSAASCRRVLAAIAAPDEADPASLVRGTSRAIPTSGTLRIGVLRGASEAMEPESRGRFDDAVDVLRSIGIVELVDLPALPWDEAATIIIHAEAASAFEQFVEEGRSLELTAPEDRYGVLDGLSMPAVDYLRAQRIRTLGAAAMTQLFQEVDVLVAPTEYRVAPEVSTLRPAYYDEHQGPSLGAAGNLCGLPAISLPTGPGRLGLPTAVEVMGPAWSDDLVLAVGEAFQTRTSWHTMRPEGLV